MTEKDENYLAGIDYEMDIGHAQYLDYSKGDRYLADMNDVMNGDETRLFYLNGLFVEVTLPRGEFE